MKKVRVRFAPSPTGFLHVGNARTALFNWLFARQNKGAFVLRIEDTDIVRSAKEYEESLMEDLKWLGLDWDEGPDIGGPFGPYRQSERLDTYRAYTQKLLEDGKAYYCFCSQEDLEKERRKAQDSHGIAVYSGRCRRIGLRRARERVEAGEQAAVRLLTPDQGTLRFRDLVRGPLEFDLMLLGDPVIVRSNGLPAYNFAVVIDDALMEITHVIRGEDHISNTPRQILVYRALSFSPPEFAHLSLVLGKDSTRLSKRHGATSVDTFRKDGILSSALFNYLALLGWAPPDGQEMLSREDLLRLFRLEKVSRSAAVFDYDKLDWLNRQHAKNLTPREKAEMAYPYLWDSGLLPHEMSPGHWAWLEKVVEAYLPRVHRFSELPAHVAQLFEFSVERLEEGLKQELMKPSAERVIRLFAEKISKTQDFDHARFIAISQEVGKETGSRGKELYHPLRVALTARASGLELASFIPLVEEGALLEFPHPMKNCAQRVSEVVEVLIGPSEPGRKGPQP